jgi:hypothetical protein
MKNIQIALSLARASDNGDKSPLFGGNTHGLARLCHRCHRLSPQIQYRQREKELSKGRRTKTTGTLPADVPRWVTPSIRREPPARRYGVSPKRPTAERLDYWMAQGKMARDKNATA